MDLRRLEAQFERIRREQLGNHDGEWVLLAPGSSARFFDDEQTAVTIGFEIAQGEPFLVKRMAEADPVISVSMVSLAFRP